MQSLIFLVPFHHGCHRSGSGQGEKNFFGVREKSGNFISSQGKVGKSDLGTLMLIRVNPMEHTLRLAKQ